MSVHVSIVVASYNYGQYIAEALESLQAQSINDWEAIIVDDGSTDGSQAVIQRFLADPRFRLIQNDHAGQPRTKNCGIRAAHGEFIAFLDADDRWKPAKLERQLNLIAKQPDLGVCYSRREVIDPDGKFISGDSRTFHRGNVLDAMFRDNFVCFSSAMVRRCVIDRVGQFDESLRLAIDYDWWLRIARHFDFDYVDEPLVLYRTGHANLSRRVGERLDTALAIMNRFIVDYDHPAKLNPAICRTAFAETYRHRGLVLRRTRPLAGLGWIIRSLMVQPLNAQTWRALAGGVLPAGVRSGLRRIKGDTVDWESRYAA